MPKISLVVCLHKERDLLERLLEHCNGCYDDLVVVHDGPEGPSIVSTGGVNSGNPGENGLKGDFVPSAACVPRWKSPEELSLSEPEAPPLELALDYADLPGIAPIPSGYRLLQGSPRPGSIHELVAARAGRFLEGPKCFQQEPHWPFGWWAAKYEWILRLDADEFPSERLRAWLQAFREGAENNSSSGYLAIWPMWDGLKEVWTTRNPSRLFLFNKRKVSFFGMAEHSPVSSTPFTPVFHIINHMPVRKSFGIANLLLRPQAYRWRCVIASSLLHSPLLLPRWNTSISEWPKHWEDIRSHPLRTACKRGVWTPVSQAVHETRRGAEFIPSAYIGSGLHQFLMGVTYFLKKHRFI